MLVIRNENHYTTRMMELKEKIIELGLTLQEFDELGEDNAIQYYKFHHNKNYKKSSILFAGLPNDKVTFLSKLASKNQITTQTRISTGLTFFCIGDVDQKRIDKAKENGSKVLTPDDFEKLFADSDYKLKTSSIIYNKGVPEFFRIGIPLHNFDMDKEISSFSLDSDEKYIMNLYQQTCSCGDFNKFKRSEYSKGDIRRLCKHLMSEYANSFGLTGLSDFQRSLIDNGHPAKEKIHVMQITSINQPIYANYNLNDEWWNLYVPGKSGVYEKYGFSIDEERFAYNEKPHGHVAELREKLKSLKGKSSASRTATKQVEKSASDKKGCAPVLIIPLILIAYYLIEYV